MQKYLVPGLLAALLAGCGGGSGGGVNGDSGVRLDAFTTLINNEYLVPSETALPADIDQLAVTAPEDMDSMAL
ncbi:MAG: hypothetical protein H7234_04280 [Herminiimonas sp.]|nr:hypothetical protein [Herminiimonas sp.]